MKVLGYPRTWTTECFIGNGCGEEVFAHTNGFGDFVLFDELGPPWPIHDCYIYRFLEEYSPSRKVFTLRSDAVAEYKETDDSRQPGRVVARDITKVLASGQLCDEVITVTGYVQDYIEHRLHKLTKNLGTIGLRHLSSIFGPRTSQITIITSEFKSITAFADLRDTAVKKRDVVATRIRAARTVGLPGLEFVFLCDELFLMHGVE